MEHAHDDQEKANTELIGRTKKKASPLRSYNEGSPTRIPLWAKLAYENQASPSLRLPDRGNNTGLPDILKAGIENLSGVPMDDVKVHYDSPKPAQVQALAYTQGTDIHVGPGQEQHLAHEAWHVVQQKQGRVPPTVQTGDVAINNDQGLEREADAMGMKAAETRNFQGDLPNPLALNAETAHVPQNNGITIQRKLGSVFLSTKYIRDEQTANIYTIPMTLPNRFPVGSYVFFDVNNQGNITRIDFPRGVVNQAREVVIENSTQTEFIISPSLRGQFSDRAKVVITKGAVVIPSGGASLQGRLYALSLELDAPAYLTKGRKSDVINLNVQESELKEKGTLVEQDEPNKSGYAPDQVFYYIGKGLAYTTRIRTCAALAIYNQQTGLSYLSHAESRTLSTTVSDNITDYIKQVKKVGGNFFDPQQTRITLFFADDTLNDFQTSSVKVITDALGKILSKIQLISLLSSISYQIVSPEDFVFVGSSHTPSISLLSTVQQTYLLKRYTTANTPSQIKEAEQEFINLMDQFNDWNDYDVRAEVFAASEIASERGNEEFQKLLLKLIGQ
ncbi:eCIS core domain-containing protein [Dictyobacter formicarum]|uniref:eCIS core domain-containing protein n=1 Tax=Dictyobacter formicarum TaxID=2778368 RepID=A0ABQ3VN28_9CHLR|nr:DUF4157 domain-containing protein [Dictyobacter formicarum]GHO87635.1 hypothetical protein KSZ_56410 [Dictyobacter formicarum]